MASAPTLPVSPRSSVDARGRLLPLTDEQERQRVAVAYLQALDYVATIGTEEERQRGSLDVLIEGLNENPLSSRKRFS